MGVNGFCASRHICIRGDWLSCNGAFICSLTMHARQGQRAQSIHAGASIYLQSGCSDCQQLTKLLHTGTCKPAHMHHTRKTVQNSSIAVCTGKPAHMQHKHKIAHDSRIAAVRLQCLSISCGVTWCAVIEIAVQVSTKEQCRFL